MYAVDSRMKSKGILSNFSVLKVVLGVDNSPIHNYYKPCDFIVKICSDAVLKKHPIRGKFGEIPVQPPLLC